MNIDKWLEEADMTSLLDALQSLTAELKLRDLMQLVAFSRDTAIKVLADDDGTESE
jgi:hypothetical protein